jgi:hypothetical protein
MPTPLEYPCMPYHTIHTTTNPGTCVHIYRGFNGACILSLSQYPIRATPRLNHYIHFGLPIYIHHPCGPVCIYFTSTTISAHSYIPRVMRDRYLGPMTYTRYCNLGVVACAEIFLSDPHCIYPSVYIYIFYSTPILAHSYIPSVMRYLHLGPMTYT